MRWRASPQSFDLDAPQFIPPPQEKYFRFATIPLRVDVPILPGGISRRGLAETKLRRRCGKCSIPICLSKNRRIFRSATWW